VEGLTGDTTRKNPPNFHNGESAYNLSLNRNKRSIAVDLKSEEGRGIFLDLVRRGDVVLENNRPGVMARLGLGYEDLAAVNPAIIMASISGFGQTGEWSRRPAFDMVIQALSGGMSLTGEQDGPSTRAGIPLCDLCAGHHAVIGLLAALYRRAQTGRGEYIDISMLDVQVSMLTYMGVYYLFSGKVPGHQGRGHMSIPTYRVFKAGDGGDVVVCANREPMWKSLCEALGLSELTEDPRFLLNANRYEHRFELWPLLDEAFLKKTRDEWVELLLAKGIPCAPINDVAEALDTPPVHERNMILEIEHQLGGSFRVIGNPIKARNANDDLRTSPPLLGENTRETLRFLGYDEARIERLLAEGVVKQNEKVDPTAE